MSFVDLLIVCIIRLSLCPSLSDHYKRNLSTNPSLTPASINHILKNLQKKAGLNQIGELSGHSFRVGAALDLLDKNIPLEKIMLRGG